jgi:hypothetical protein
MNHYLIKRKKKKNVLYAPGFDLVEMIVPLVMTIMRSNHPAGNAAPVATDQSRRQIEHRAAVLLRVHLIGLLKDTNKKIGVLPLIKKLMIGKVPAEKPENLLVGVITLPHAQK